MSAAALGTEQKRLFSLYAKHLPRIVFGGNSVFNEPVLKVLSCEKKMVFVVQTYDHGHPSSVPTVEQKTNGKRKRKIEQQGKPNDDNKNTFCLTFKSGFFRTLCEFSDISLERTDTFCSFFYVEEICANKDHLLHLLSFVSCLLRRGGYLIGTCFDAQEVLLEYAEDTNANTIQVPRKTFEQCQLHLLDGKNNATCLSNLKIPLHSDFSLLGLDHESGKSVPSLPKLFDWKTMEKQILRFGFRLVETKLFTPFPHIKRSICRSFVFQLYEHILF